MRTTDKFLSCTRGKIIKRMRMCCEEETHTIGINQKGQFVFLDHDRFSLRRWRNYITIGGMACGCLGVLKWWKARLGWPTNLSSRSRKERSLPKQLETRDRSADWVLPNLPKARTAESRGVPRTTEQEAVGEVAA